MILLRDHTELKKRLETGLELVGMLFLDDDTDLLQLQVRIDRPENPGKTVLQ